MRIKKSSWSTAVLVIASILLCGNGPVNGRRQSNTRTKGKAMKIQLLDTDVDKIPLGEDPESHFVTYSLELGDVNMVPFSDTMNKEEANDDGIDEDNGDYDGIGHSLHSLPSKDQPSINEKGSVGAKNMSGSSTSTSTSNSTSSSVKQSDHNTIEEDEDAYLNSLPPESLLDADLIYNNTFKNPIYYLHRVHHYIKREYDDNDEEEVPEGMEVDTVENDYFEFGSQLEGFALFVYESMIDIAFSPTKGVVLSNFYYYGVNFFEKVKDTEVTPLISSGYSAL